MSGSAPPPRPASKFATTLRAMRIEAGLSPAELAARMRFTRATEADVVAAEADEGRPWGGWRALMAARATNHSPEAILDAAYTRRLLYEHSGRDWAYWARRQALWWWPFVAMLFVLLAFSGACVVMAVREALGW